MKFASWKIAAAAAVVLLLPTFAMAQATIEVSQEFDRTCYLTTFEGNGHGNSVGSIGNEDMTFTFDANWVTITSGPYGNNPTPPTATVLVGPGPGPIEGHSGEVTFSTPVKGVTLFYASIGDVELIGYDSDNNVVASVTGAENFTNGFYDFDLLSMEVSTNSISRVVLVGNGNQVAIDNFQACTITTDPVELLANLIEIVDEINYVQGISNSLDGKLDAIYAALSDTNDNNDSGACNALDALVIYVEAQWSVGRLTDEQALFLVDAADTIIALLCAE